MGWNTTGSVVRGTRDATIFVRFGGSSGWRLSGVKITSTVTCNGASKKCSGSVTFDGGSSAAVGSVYFNGLNPGTNYSVSISSTGSYYNITKKKQMTCSATSSFTFTTLREVTISYNANGGNNPPGAVVIAEGDGITIPGGIGRDSTTSAGTITVTYNPNGGTGCPPAQTGTFINQTDYTFSSWSGKSPGEWFAPTSSVTLDAWWSSNTWRKTNPRITLSASYPYKEYYTFAGWSTNPSAATGTYNAGGTYEFGNNVTLYAIFKPNPPHNVWISRSGGNTGSISVNVGASGLPRTNYRIYYKLTSSSSYSYKDLGTGTSTTIDNLSVDTNYHFYVAATNAGGVTNSGVATFSTTLNNPSITKPTVTNILPFTCTVAATGSISPGKTLSYRFSKDNGSTWTAWQTSNTYNWTGLNEETTYNMAVQVRASHVGVNAVDTYASNTTTITTPADQAKIRRMVDGQWKKGKTYIMVNGKWVKAKKLYIMVNGQWKINKND